MMQVLTDCIKYDMAQVYIDMCTKWSFVIKSFQIEFLKMFYNIGLLELSLFNHFWTFIKIKLQKGASLSSISLNC